MNIFLSLAIILGLFGTIFAGHYDGYEFFDSHGRCWRCFTGSNCVRCNDVNPIADNFPPDWSRECPTPTTADCDKFPGAKFPHLDINRYYLCAVGQIVTVRCFCDMMFDITAQRCIYTDEVTRFSCINYTINPEVTPCTGRRIHPY